MFSKKYKEDLLKERVDKLNQLDRIEFNQREINHNAKDSIVLTRLWGQTIILWIITIFSINYTIKSELFKSLELFNIAKGYTSISLIGSFLIIIITISIFAGILINLIAEKKFQEENEAFLEERLKKK